MFIGPFDQSIIKRAQDKKLLELNIVNIRDFSTDRHKTVDDRPYGGGAGMILRVDVIDKALQSVVDQKLKTKDQRRIILLDPAGKKFSQDFAKKLSKFNHLILICGHYEGVDARVRKLIDEEISVGDYILTGGEIPSMVITDAITRLIPDVLTKTGATRLESFNPYTIHHTPYTALEYPQFTRPPIYRKWRVPDILLSGNHAKIKKWQEIESKRRTLKGRPDLITTQKD